MQSLRPIIVPHNRLDHEHRIQIANGTASSDYVSITPLGSGQEVGRSCLVIKYKGKCVMLDCGLHPALKGQDAMPYLDFLDLENVDLLLVTHFHLDHAACLPYFLSKTAFKSRCFMTHPTKSIYKLIVQDFVKVSTLSADNVLFGEKELMDSMDKIETVDYHQDKIVNGIRFRAYHAGHVLGAAMFMIEIANVKILYTGDYSCDDDRHLKGAEIPNEKPDILIIESTFGTQSLRPVRDREKEFTSLVHQIIKRGGRCLIPVFALGRAQELLLIMDEYWSNNKSLHHIPIYYASALAKKCLQVYQTYINMMNPRIQQQYKVSNPFEFKHVFNLRSRDQFNDVGPSVVFASPGMLQNGLSRELFEMWCTDRRNGLVIPGYAVEGTLAKIVQSEPREVDGMRGGKLPLRMTVHYVMFAAHADHDQTKRFITELKPPNVILVHGERKAMSRVKLSLNRSFGDFIRISDPANCQSVQIEFRKDKICKVVGNLVDEMNHEVNKSRYRIPKKISDDTNDDKMEQDHEEEEGKDDEKDTNEEQKRDDENNKNEEDDKPNFDGLLVRKDFNYHIMAPKDLSNFTPLTSTKIEQTLMIPFNQSFTALSLFISRIYDIKYINSEDQSETNKIIVHIVDDYNISSHIKQQKKEDDEKKLKEIEAKRNGTDTGMNQEEEEEEDEDEDEDIDIVLDDNHNRRVPKKQDNDKEENDDDDNDEDNKIITEEQDIDNDLSVTLEKINKKHVKLTWKSSAISDMIADSIIGLALTLDVDPSTAIAQQMMQPVNDPNDNQNRQSQPHPANGNLSSVLPSQEAFEFILGEHFGPEYVECIKEEDQYLFDNTDADINGINNNNNSHNNKMAVLWHNRNVVKYKYIVRFEESVATISFKYNYKRLYDTQKNQKYFWGTKKEKLENNLSKKNNSKIQKKLSQFQMMLDMIDDNEEMYFDQQFIPCFEVESDDERLKKRIEAILACVDNALYPISCDFDCLEDYNSIFDHGLDEEIQDKKAIELPSNPDDKKVEEMKVEQEQQQQQEQQQIVTKTDDDPTLNEKKESNETSIVDTETSLNEEAAQQNNDNNDNDDVTMTDKTTESPAKTKENVEIVVEANVNDNENVKIQSENDNENENENENANNDNDNDNDDDDDMIDID